MKQIIRGLIAICLLVSEGRAQRAGADLFSGHFTAIPLTDLGPKAYKGFEGGLYPNGSNRVPAEHAAAGMRLAREVRPLDAEGRPHPNGKIVLTSIGMSNSADEFGLFMRVARTSPNVNNTNVVILNGAFGGFTTCYWESANGAPPCSMHSENQFDRVHNSVLWPAGVSEQQVQVVWILEANGGPGIQGCGKNRFQPCKPLCDPQTKGCENDPLYTEALRYEAQLGRILRAAKIRWPNLRLAFLSSRIYAGYAKVPISPEPFAYEYGFSVKWLIEAQIKQMQTGSVDPVAGDLNYAKGEAPWIAWGPYVWADGDSPRLDGLVWCNGQENAPCQGRVEFQPDGTHPNALGQRKVADILKDFFLQSPFSSPWFEISKAAYAPHAASRGLLHASLVSPALDSEDYP